MKKSLSILAVILFTLFEINAQDKIIDITVKGVTFNMIKVEGGTFTMGATAEQGSDAKMWNDSQTFIDKLNALDE